MKPETKGLFVCIVAAILAVVASVAFAGWINPSGRPDLNPALGPVFSKSGNVGIKNPSPPEKFTLSSGSFLQDAPLTAPKVVGGHGAMTGFPDLSAAAVAVSGKYAYVWFYRWAYDDKSLRVVDISNPSSPTVLPPPPFFGELGPSGSSLYDDDIFIAGRYAYFKSGALSILDVSNPNAPIITWVYNGSWSLCGEAPPFTLHAVAPVGGMLYLFGHSIQSSDPDTMILDVSNPAAPRCVKSFDDYTSTDAYFAYPYRYTLSAVGGGITRIITVTDFSDPANPEKFPEVNTAGLPTSGAAPHEIVVSGRYAYVLYRNPLNPSEAFRIVDVGNPDPSTNPPPNNVFRAVGGAGLGSGLPAATPVDIAVAGRYAYLIFDAAGQNALRIIDISDPVNPRVVGGQNLSANMPPNGKPTDIVVAGRYAYVSFDCGDTRGGPPACSASDAFRIIDVSGVGADEGSASRLNALETDILEVTGGAAVDNTLEVREGFSVGGLGARLLYAAQNLVGYWNFDEPFPTSGNRTSPAFDSSGRNNDGSVSYNGYSRIAGGKYGNGIRFSGTGGNQPAKHVELAESDIYDNLAQGTIMAWVNIETAGGPGGPFFGADSDYCKTPLKLQFYKRDFGPMIGQRYVFEVLGSSNPANGCNAPDVRSYWRFPAIPAPTLQWVHLAYVVDGSGFKLYVNGVDKTGDPDMLHDVDPPINPRFFFSSAAVGRTRYNIGAAVGGDRYAAGVGNFEGSIDEMRIYDRALPTAEIQEAMNTAPPAGLTFAPTSVFSGDVGVNGNLRVYNSLSNPGKGFEIDHPLAPRDKILRHMVMESPELKNMYDGIATLDGKGEATIGLPSYFEALNRDFRYAATPLGRPEPDLYIKEPVRENKFVIAGGSAGARVSWQVTGIRKDPSAEAHPLVVEERKAAPGYLYPELYGEPERKKIPEP